MVKLKEMTAKELAQQLGADPRQVRRFLRKEFPNLSGRPGNWVIDRCILRQLKKDWNAAQVHPRSDHAEKRPAILQIQSS